MPHTPNTPSRRVLLAGLLSVFTLTLLCRCGHNTGEQDGAPSGYINTADIPDAKPVKLAKSRYGNPKSYKVFGKRYWVLPTAHGYDKVGIASWYGTKFHGRLTSTREPYDMYAMTAASPNLPIPCFARVTNLKNGRSIIVKVNDRGPFAPHRIIDLSYVAAKKLDMLAKGTARVRVTTVMPGQFRQHTPLYASNRHPQPKATEPENTLTTSGPVYLQMGAFQDPSNARYLEQQLRTAFKEPVRITEAQRAGKRLYQVRLGPLQQNKKINALRNELSQRGFGEGITVPSHAG
jgi:rare lipoprotein A